MGGMDFSRETVRIRFHRAHKIEAEQREVCEVIPAEGFAVQMGMNQAQAFEACGSGTVSCKVRDNDFSVVADDDKQNVSLSADQYADLPADLTGELCQVSRQFMGEDSGGLDFSAVKLFDSLQLAGFEAGQIAINTVDMNSLHLFW
jgi:hypothetical protein